jgi:hypothetical protein
MIYHFRINAFSVPNTANKPLFTVTVASGAPCAVVRLDTGPRASAAAWIGFTWRKVDSAEEGGTAVNATAMGRAGWTKVPYTVVTKGTFTGDPTLIAVGTAGAEGGGFTFDAVGSYPWSPPVLKDFASGEEWALCTPDSAPTAQTIDFDLYIEE